MTKTILLAAILGCCSTWVIAQSSTQNGSASGSSSMSGNQSTVQGCLVSSGGNYTLTDSSGTEYQLSGDSSQLSAHVNQEVRVTGTLSSSANSNSMGTQGTGTATTAAQMFTVSKVKKLANSCSTGK